MWKLLGLALIVGGAFLFIEGVQIIFLQNLPIGQGILQFCGGLAAAILGAAVYLLSDPRRR